MTPRALRNTILYVEDDAFCIDAYRNSIKEHGNLSRYELKVRLKIRTAISTLDNMLKKEIPCSLELAIIDLQVGNSELIPDGEFEKYNKLSGLWLLSKYSELLVKNKIPVFILTNQKDKEYQDILQAIRNDCGFPGDCLVAKRKTRDTSPRNLPDQLWNLIDNSRYHW